MSVAARRVHVLTESERQIPEARLTEHNWLTLPRRHPGAKGKLDGQPHPTG